MNKIKKASNNLRHYLGRDKEGLKFLDALDRVANDSRRRANMEEERADRAEVARGEMSESLAKAKIRIEGLERDLEVEVRKREGSERSNVNWKEEADKLAAELESTYGPVIAVDGDPEDFYDIPTLRNHMRSLIRRSRRAPRQSDLIRAESGPKSVAYCDDVYGAYDLESVIKDLSSSELLELGRFVAIMSIVGFPVVVVEREQRVSGCGVGHRISRDMLDKVMSRFVPWLGHNVDLEDHAEMGGIRVGFGAIEVPQWDGEGATGKRISRHSRPASR